MSNSTYKVLVPTDFTDVAKTAIGDVLEITGIDNGTFIVDFYNIYTGEIVATNTYRASEDTIMIELPSFERNIVAVGRKK